MRRTVLILSVLLLAAAHTGAAGSYAATWSTLANNQTPFEHSESAVSLTPWSNSFDLATGARAIAMGTAISANPSAESSFIFNPALLAESEGIKLYYSLPPSNVGRYEGDYYSLGLTMETSEAGFALDYSRYDSDQHTIYTYSELIHTIGENYDYTITASAARKLYRGLSCGVSLKYYGRGANHIDAGLEDYGSEGIWGANIGLCYRTGGFVRSGNSEDNFRFALAMRNFSTSAYLCFWEMSLNSNPRRTITGTKEEVASGMVLSDSSVAVTVNEPAAFMVTLIPHSQPESWVFGGRLALASVELNDTVWVIEVTWW